MNQNDLRVKKTKKAIHNTFMELLKTKPVSKISVTELAKAAEINKAPESHITVKHWCFLWSLMLSERLPLIIQL